MIISLASVGPAPGSSANLSVLSLNACINPLDLESVTLISKSPEVEGLSVFGCEDFICITEPVTVADKLLNIPDPNILSKSSAKVACPNIVPSVNAFAILSVAILVSLAPPVESAVVTFATSVKLDCPAGFISIV